MIGGSGFGLGSFRAWRLGRSPPLYFRIEGARHETLGRIGQAQVDLAGHVLISGLAEHDLQGVAVSEAKASRLPLFLPPSQDNSRRARSLRANLDGLAAQLLALPRVKSNGDSQIPRVGGALVQ